MSQNQPTLFSFFSKTPNGNSSPGPLKKDRPGGGSPKLKSINSTPSSHLGNGSEKLSNVSSIKIRGNDIKSLDLVWAKLEGYPWWPALVYEHPVEKIIYRKKQIHVQFFDDPPTRGWVRDVFVKPYGSPESCGVPTYRDPEWIRAKHEADQVVSLPHEERSSLIVEMVPSDAESCDDEDNSDDSDVSKENDLNISNGMKRTAKGDSKGPQSKKRRIIIMSESEASEDEYKPDVEELEDESGSSGVDENQVSEMETETESESGTPVKNPKKPNPKKLPSTSSKNPPKRNVTFTPKAKPDKFPVPKTPSVSDSTKSKLSSFAAKEVSTPTRPTENDDWPHTKLIWLQPDRVRDRDMRMKDDPEYNPRTLYVPEEFLNKQTPAMRQWWELKSHHFDVVIFFKMGKFYELFHMDAILSIQELGLLMMKGEYAHTGFPEIAYGRYSSTLIEKGYKVARVEQVETPDMMEKRCKSMSRPTKYDKVVKRELCQVTSLGTRIPSVIDGDASDTDHHFLLSITERLSEGPGDKRQFGVAFIDTSMGVFYVGQFEDDRHVSRLRTLIAHFPPAQILMEKGRISPKTMQLLKAVTSIGLLESLAPEKEFWNAAKTLNFLAESDFFKTDGVMEWPQTLKDMMEGGDSLGLIAKGTCELGISSLGGLIWYLQFCRLEEDLLTRRMFEHYFPPDASEESTENLPNCEFRKHMILDGTTLRNLEMFENSSDGSSEGTLFETLNHCSTPFGKRLLHNWLCTPLCSKAAINSRLDAIEDLRENPEVTAVIKPMLKSLPDLEKLLSKIHSVGLKHSADHPDTRAIYFEGKVYSQRKVTDFLSAVNGFRTCVDVVKSFKSLTSSLKSKLLRSCVTYQEDGGKFYQLDDVLKFFDNAFDHSLAKKEGKIIPSEGVDPEYDDAVKKIKETRKELDDYLKEQSRFFGAKVTYWGNDKKRFQLEIPDHATKKVNNDYELVSQKKGFRRYYTQETKDFLTIMTAAEELKENALQDIARRIFQQFDQHHKEWAAAVECIAVLDVLLSFAEFSLKVDSTRPVIESPSEVTQPFIVIREGRHPCAIKIFSGGDYIPNDVILANDDGDLGPRASLILVTGPNMGGKSTLMRQTALLCVMAQLGCFVPALECRLSVVDRIFTRLGAWDRIYQGESTFYVELAETASMMRHATRHSLVIVDELGRGTATYDGTAIAHSVVNALKTVGCRTLFSTHYHSLVDEFKETEGVSLGHMACMVESENDDDPSQETITFLYKFSDGACPKSYGFNAARLADLPESVIQSASKKAKELERVNKRKKALRLLFAGFQHDKSLRESVLSVQTIA